MSLCTILFFFSRLGLSRTRVCPLRFIECIIFVVFPDCIITFSTILSKLDISVFLRFVKRPRWQPKEQVMSGAPWLSRLCELALQKDPGNTKPFLLVDRLSEDIVISD